MPGGENGKSKVYASLFRGFKRTSNLQLLV